MLMTLLDKVSKARLIGVDIEVIYSTAPTNYALVITTVIAVATTQHDGINQSVETPYNLPLRMCWSSVACEQNAISSRPYLFGFS